MCFNENWDTASCLLVTDILPSPPELWTWAALLCNEGWTTGLPDAFHQLITVFWDEAEMSWTARNSYDLERHLHYGKWWYFLSFFLFWLFPTFLIINIYLFVFRLFLVSLHFIRISEYCRQEVKRERKLRTMYLYTVFINLLFSFVCLFIHYFNNAELIKTMKHKIKLKH